MNWRDKARRLMGRNRPLPETPEDSAEDWNVGDLAECVIAGSWVTWTPVLGIKGSGPQRGEIRIVRAVRIASGLLGPAQYLYFERYGPHSGFNAGWFRKITPKADEATRADAEWLADLIGSPMEKAR